MDLATSKSYPWMYTPQRLTNGTWSPWWFQGRTSFASIFLGGGSMLTSCSSWCLNILVGLTTRSFGDLGSPWLFHLVGGWTNSFEKNVQVKLDSTSPRGEIKHIWNHHLGSSLTTATTKNQDHHPLLDKKRSIWALYHLFLEGIAMLIFNKSKHSSKLTWLNGKSTMNEDCHVCFEGGTTARTRKRKWVRKIHILLTTNHKKSQIIYPSDIKSFMQTDPIKEKYIVPFSGVFCPWPWTVFVSLMLQSLLRVFLEWVLGT